MIILGFIDSYPPQNYGRMIPIAADHAADVIHSQRFPGLIPDMLPSGNFLEHEQSDLITTVKEVPRLRIMRSANNIAFQILAENVRIALLYATGHRLPHERERLMPIEPAQF